MQVYVLIGGLVFPVFVIIFAVSWIAMKTTWIRIQSAREPRCTKCGSRDVRHSWSVTLMDRIYGVFNCFPYRCRSCHDRFYRAETKAEQT